MATETLLSDSINAIPLSVIQADERNLLPLILSNYTNIQKGKYPHAEYNHVENDLWLLKSKVMKRHQFVFHKEQYQKDYATLLQLILSFVSEGYYLSGKANDKYISAKAAYDCYDTNTIYLIHGYNLKDQIFYAAGKTKNKVFEKYTISFEEYFNAIFNRWKPTFDLNFIKAGELNKAKFNYSKFHDGILDYLNSRNRSDGIIPEGNAMKYIYGIECYKDFAQNLMYIQESREYIEPENYLIFLEHHKVIHRAIELLEVQNHIAFETIILESQEICNLSERIYSSCLSYNILHFSAQIKTIVNDVNSIINKEITLLYKVIEKLKTIDSDSD